MQNGEVVGSVFQAFKQLKSVFESQFKLMQIQFNLQTKSSLQPAVLQKAYSFCKLSVLANRILIRDCVQPELIDSCPKINQRTLNKITQLVNLKLKFQDILNSKIDKIPSFGQFKRNFTGRASQSKIFPLMKYLSQALVEENIELLRLIISFSKDLALVNYYFKVAKCKVDFQIIQPVEPFIPDVLSEYQLIRKQGPQKLLQQLILNNRNIAIKIRQKPKAQRFQINKMVCSNYNDKAKKAESKKQGDSHQLTVSEQCWEQYERLQAKPSALNKEKRNGSKLQEPNKKSFIKNIKTVGWDNAPTYRSNTSRKFVIVQLANPKPDRPLNRQNNLRTSANTCLTIGQKRLMQENKLMTSFQYFTSVLNPMTTARQKEEQERVQAPGQFKSCRKAKSAKRVQINKYSRSKPYYCIE